MNKQEVIDKAQSYSRNALVQKGYVEGFQAACCIIYSKLNTCHMAEFVTKMEELSEVAHMDFGEELENLINS